MDEFYKSILPESYTILGREIHKLTLGHLLILHRLNVIPVSSNEDLITSVLVCSSNEYTLEEIYNDKWLSLKMRIWRWQLGEPDWITSHTLWLDYFTESTQLPSFRSLQDGSSEDSATPFLQVIKTTLQAKLNYSPKEVLACPFQEAVWAYLTYHELEGSIVINDRDHRKEMKRLADEFAAEMELKHKENNGS